MANRNGDAISTFDPVLIQAAFALSAREAPPTFGPDLQLVPAKLRPDPAAAQSIPASFEKDRARSQATVRLVEP